MWKRVETLLFIFLVDQIKMYHYYNTFATGTEFTYPMVKKIMRKKANKFYTTYKYIANSKRFFFETMKLKLLVGTV